MKRSKIVVCGAAGNQGGAVARALLQKDIYQVVALTRDIHSEHARYYRYRGAEVVYADHKDQSAMAGAFKDAWGVFAVTQPWDGIKGRYDVQNELIQAKNIVWAAKEAGVSHLIAASFINPMSELTGCTFVDSKLTFESLILQLQIPATILRLPILMEHIDRPETGRLTIRGNFSGDLRVPYLSLEDLGRFVERAFADAAGFRHRTIDMVADLISGVEIAEIFCGDAFSKQIRYKPVPALKLKFASPEIYCLRRFFSKFSLPGYQNALITSLQQFRKMYPEAGSVRDFVRQEQYGRSL
jgi:uncharacterized protein YbjT (DUF2867 family)